MIVIAMQDFHRGGTERVALNLARHWCDAGRAVTILCGSEAGGLRDQADPRIMVVPLGVPRGFLSRWRLGRAMARVLLSLKPGIVFLPGNFHLPLANALRRAAPGTAIAAKISNPPAPFALARPVFRWLTRGVSAFAAMNEGLAGEMRALVPGKPVAMLRDPVQIGDAVPVARHVGLNLLWIGRLEPQKDAPLALSVTAALALPVHLTLIGDGREAAAVALQAAGLPVTRIAQVADVSPYIAAADVLLITSRYEGGPAVAVEALALGVPVVATDCSYLLREIVITPQAGRLVASRDPQLLAQAVADVARTARPPRETLAALVAAYAPMACAQAYLDWFATL
ncbi:MAG TPA: glycosyltransferase [Rhizomicrobium sp.]|jgi:glycosyltransferase involved in cell wall biosynthesis|nr:glycosyltransferase [Rhizomicrobium sp.]